MMVNQEFYMIFTPEEAWLIEDCFKGADKDFTPYKPFLLRLGLCVTTNTPQTAEVSVDLLWYLRSIISVGARLGKATGSDLLLRIYGFLLRANKARLLVDWEEMNHGNLPALRDPNQDGAESSAEDNTCATPSA